MHQITIKVWTKKLQKQRNQKYIHISQWLVQVRRLFNLIVQGCNLKMSYFVQLSISAQIQQKYFILFCLLNR